jgi:hypothetical protein
VRVAAAAHHHDALPLLLGRAAAGCADAGRSTLRLGDRRRRRKREEEHPALPMRVQQRRLLRWLRPRGLRRSTVKRKEALEEAVRQLYSWIKMLDPDPGHVTEYITDTEAAQAAWRAVGRPNVARDPYSDGLRSIVQQEKEEA